MSTITVIRLAFLASWVTCTLSFNFLGLNSVKKRLSLLRSEGGDAPKFFITEAVDDSVLYDAAAKLAYEASDKSMTYERFKIKYVEEAVALVKSKQPGYVPEAPAEPFDVSIPYDAAALLAYEASGSRLVFEAYKRIYIEETVNMVTTKQKSRKKVGAPLTPKPPGYRPPPPEVVNDRVAKFIAKIEKEKDMAFENALEFLKTADFKQLEFPELQKGVPTEAVKGAALLTAALALLATKGVVISSAAGASAAYAALQQGAVGDMFRTFGGVTWDATEAATQLARAATADKRVTGLTKELAATVAGAVDRYKGAEDEVIKSRQGSDMEEIDAADQVLEESSEDLARILEEAEAAIGQADAAMALADQTLGKESQEEEEDDDDFVPVEEIVMEGEEAEEEVMLQEATEVESPEEEGGEDDEAADEMDGEWAMTLEMAQQGIDGKIVGMDEVINDDGAKADWDAAGILAKALGQAGSEEQFIEEGAEEEEVFTISDEEFEDGEEDASTSSDSDMEDADAWFPEGDLEDVARAAREAVARMDDKNVDDEEDASTSSDSDMEDADAWLPEGDLEDIARAAREAVARMDDQNVDDEEDASTSSDSDMAAADAMLPEGDLEDIARAAREAVAMLDDKNKEDEIVMDETDERTISFMRDWSKLTVAKLREELRVRGLKAYGKKSNLVAALGKYDAEAFPDSVAGGRGEDSSSSDSDGELDFDDVALAELGRQARAAVQAYDDLDDDNADEVEDDKEESDDIDTKDLFAALDLQSLGEDSRAAVDTQPVDEPSDDVLQELEDELLLESSKDFSSMTVIELKDELRSKGLKIGGKKAELIERLQSA